MITLSNTQRKYLRSIAHTIHPIVIIGINGLNENVQQEIIQTLLSHELLKIKIKADKSEKQAIITQILTQTQAVLVQSIGSIIVIYKAFDHAPKILLPKK